MNSAQNKNIPRLNGIESRFSRSNDTQTALGYNTCRAVVRGRERGYDGREIERPYRRHVISISYMYNLYI